MGIFGTLLAGLENPLEEVVSRSIHEFTIGSWTFAFTNHMFMIALASIVLMVGLPLALRHQALVPRGFTNAIETICVYLREDMARPMLKEHTDRYIGVLWTLFFFILTMNLLGVDAACPAYLAFAVCSKPALGRCGDGEYLCDGNVGDICVLFVSCGRYS